MKLISPVFTIYIVIGFSAIRKWDQAIRERNDFKDQFVKVKRQHEDAVKEINQNMNVRIKASKDIKRLTDERNAAMQVPLKKNEFKSSSRLSREIQYDLGMLIRSSAIHKGLHADYVHYKF